MSRKADEAEAALDGVREACAAETASAQKALDDKTSSDLAPFTEKLSEAEAAVREVQDEFDVVLDGPRAAQTELEAVEAKLSVCGRGTRIQGREASNSEEGRGRPAEEGVDL